MKKTFKLNIQDKNPDQLLEKIKQEVRKYVKRERRKKLPPASDFWLFDCKFGVTEGEAEEVKLRDLFTYLDAAIAQGVTSFYVEILAKPALRKPRGRLAQHADLSDEDDDLGE
jgi:Family of unknown function (DUF6172)